jgi:hypothetical protein
MKNVNMLAKYLLIGIFTFLAIRYIPTGALQDEEIIAVALCVSVVYALIDRMLPSYVEKN